MIDWLQIAWAAGFLDGEGCIQLMGYNRHPGCPSITFNQTKRRGLDRFRAIFGGSIRKRGCPTTKRSRGTRTGYAYAYNLHGPGAMRACRLMFPFLTEKQEQAGLLMDYRQECWQDYRGGDRNRGPVIPQKVLDLRAWYRDKLKLAKRRED